MSQVDNPTTGICGPVPTIKYTRKQYERALKILDASEHKVRRARQLVDFWEEVEAENKDKIGTNVLTGIKSNQDLSIRIYFEAPAEKKNGGLKEE